MITITKYHKASIFWLIGLQEFFYNSSAGGENKNKIPQIQHRRKKIIFTTKRIWQKAIFKGDNDIVQEYIRPQKKILVSGKKKFEKWPGHPGLLFFHSESRGGEIHVISPRVLTESLWSFHTL